MIVMTGQHRTMEVTPFEGYVATAGDVLLRLAMVLTAERSAAQDVVQSVFERAFRDWERISRLEHREAYVRRMITNEALSLHRRARRIVLTDVVPEPRLVQDDSAHAGDTEELVVAIRRLPPRQRAVIALRYFADLSDAEIADAMGCRETTVRGYAMRGLKRLRVDLGPSRPPGSGVPPTPTREHEEES